MKFFICAVAALVMFLSDVGAAIAQLSPSVMEMEKERLRKANEEAAPKITAGEVAAASAARKTDKVLGYEAGCAAKQAVACFELGNHLRTKNGRTPQDAVDAATAYGLACQLSHPEGCNIYGEIREKGEGLRIPRDPMMALNAYGQSCKLGFSNGCYNAATLLSSGKSPDPALQAKQAQAAKSLYKAGCDLKNYYSCKAIGLAPPEPIPAAAKAQTTQEADAAYFASLSSAKKAGDVKARYTGYIQWGAEQENARKNARSPRIDAAIDAYTNEVAQQGYQIELKSYVIAGYIRHKIDLIEGTDYIAFAACSETCVDVRLLGLHGMGMILSPKDKDIIATTRFVKFTAKQSELYELSVGPKCAPEPCAVGSEASGTLVIYRRPKMLDIEATSSSGANAVAAKSSVSGLRVHSGGHSAAEENSIRLMARSPRIEKAIQAQTTKMEAQGFELVSKGHVVKRYPDEHGTLYKIPVSNNADYVFFAACNEVCNNVYMLGYSDKFVETVKAANKDILATSRWLDYSPKVSGEISVQVVTKCSTSVTQSCPADIDAGAQTVVYRRNRL